MGGFSHSAGAADFSLFVVWRSPVQHNPQVAYTLNSEPKPVATTLTPC